MVADEIALSICTEENELVTEFELGRGRVKTEGRTSGPKEAALAFSAWDPSISSNRNFEIYKP